jgi:hypothetical protein
LIAIIQKLFQGEVLDCTQFNFDLLHRAGKASGKPDAMSRRDDHDDGRGDNKDQTLLKSEWLKIATTSVITTLITDPELLERIRNIRNYDRQVQKALREGLIKGPIGEEMDEWNEEEGIIFWRGKMYIPRAFS